MYDHEFTEPASDRASPICVTIIVVDVCGRIEFFSPYSFLVAKMMFLNNSRILSSIAIIVGSGTFWIVQDGCQNSVSVPTCSTVSPAGYGKTCTNSKCTAQGSIDDFDGICTTECKTGDSFTRYEGCSVCTHTTVYGTSCEPSSLIPGSTTKQFPCSSTNQTNPGGKGVFTCSQKDCGTSFNYTIDCTSSGEENV